MTAFVPIASAPIADQGVKNISFASADVTLGNPTVDSTTLTHNHVFATDDVTLGNPTVDSTPLTEVDPIEVDDILLGNPTVGSTAISQNHTLTGLYNGTAISVPNLTIFEDETFSAPNVLTGLSLIHI